ncbi:hypothetical protein FVER14953_21505 [Fusarium verticillioides]|nr:hypothetical protein FVER14953_21505 [Fusarium verticillioides]
MHSDADTSSSSPGEHATIGQQGQEKALTMMQVKKTTFR